VKLQGEHLFPIERERLWEALLDPTLLARVLPGAAPLVATGDNAWRTALAVAVGPVQGRFQGSLALSDLVVPESYRMQIDGSGPAGFLRGTGAIRLVAETAGATRLVYELDAQVGGRVASVGQRLVESSARALARQGLEGLERELAARAAPAASPGVSPALPKPPTQAQFAARFARGLWSELPPSWRLGLVALVLALLAGAALLLRGC
jgi:carbon monoxide dehydrogenase subunit G